MKKKILLLIALILFYCNNVSAVNYGGCDYSAISRMKSIVKNINVSYDYHIVDGVAYFDVTLTNITPDLYFVDSLGEKYYTYSSTEEGEIIITNYTSSGNYRFYSNVDECYGISLGTKYYTLPTYNKYYESDTCKEIPNFSLCQKWASVNYSEEKFESLALSYKNTIKEEEEIPDDVVKKSNGAFDKIAELYINYYYYFLGGIIIACSTIIIIKRRNDKFKL